ncbi:carbon-nitrogen hydrolase [Protomyces lactucae-debilis]|uniref:Carbon-nitrogen hydrolase n=1 Tax=Protomyces lactucae-debilis TaxID=2754530 RepID=A0A1Y2FFH4_PROLT|nr:carbon-nitrogen hydrolase [Protomyces lactucae-debilis]ORY82683.1 carbon-nitrogen hydrolase [Protomyces lactucae-debilis]
MPLIAVAQLCSTHHIKTNLLQCTRLVEAAKARGARCIFLPEASDFIGHDSKAAFSLTDSPECASFRQSMRQLAQRCKIDINVGLHERHIDTQGIATNKLSNVLTWFFGDGQEPIDYRKLHLFDVDVPGGPVVKESAWTQPGQAPIPPIDTSIGRVGLAICFDLRFPELAAHLRAQGAQILVYPSAFAVKTGQAHWEVLLRARAIDTGCFVIAAAQCGAHNEKRRSFGHAMVVDPWGEVIARREGDLADEEGLLFAEIDLDRVEQVRRALPLAHRTDIQWTR